MGLGINDTKIVFIKFNKHMNVRCNSIKHAKGTKNTNDNKLTNIVICWGLSYYKNSCKVSIFYYTLLNFLFLCK